MDFGHTREDKISSGYRNNNTSSNPKNSAVNDNHSLGDIIFEKLQQSKVFESCQPGSRSRYLDELKDKVPERDVQPDIQCLHQSDYRPVRGAQPNFLGELKQKVPKKDPSVASI